MRRLLLPTQVLSLSRFLALLLSLTLVLPVLPFTHKPNYTVLPIVHRGKAQNTVVAGEGGACSPPEVGGAFDFLVVSDSALTGCKGLSRGCIGAPPEAASEHPPRLHRSNFEATGYLLMAGKRHESAACLQRARDVGASHGFFSVECKACLGLGRMAFDERVAVSARLRSSPLSSGHG